MGDAKHAPNPLPCGCGAMGIQDLENAVDDGHCLRVGYKNVHVVHCPLHGAAPDLLAACEAAYAVFFGNVAVPGTCDAIDILDAAIRKAKGQS